MKTRVTAFMVLMAAISTGAQAQSVTDNTLLISPGDDLHVSIQDMPEMEQFPRVTDKGEIPIRGAGNIYVAHMSPSEAAAVIHDRLVSSHFLNHPLVSVVVDQYVTQNVTIIGEVHTPGTYPIATPRPILDVIALSGGLNEVAERNILVERHGDLNHPIHYNLSNDGEKAIKDQVQINPGDTIVVPKAGIVYVLGDVNRPGGYTMTNNESKMSLLQAVAMAGGASRTAKLNSSKLVHSGDQRDTQIALGDIQKGKQQDLFLAPGDIIYIPFSYVKNLVITGSSGITGAASAAAIYAGH